MGRPARRARCHDAAADREGLLLDARAPRSAREAGADAALLILRDLDDLTARELMHEADALGLDTLVEAHDAEELERAVALDAPVVGVNARDLTRSSSTAPRSSSCSRRRRATGSSIAESAIETRAQGAAAELAGANAMLVGSTLMRAPDPGAKLPS